MRILVAASLVLALGLSACTPASFIQRPPAWNAITVLDGLEYEVAFAEVVDVLARRFDLEMISKDGGYVRTAWIHNWLDESQYDDSYRVRATVKFSARRDTVDVKTEAQYRDEIEWVMGTDTRLLEEVRSAVHGVVGR